MIFFIRDNFFIRFTVLTKPTDDETPECIEASIHSFFYILDIEQLKDPKHAVIDERTDTTTCSSMHRLLKYLGLTAVMLVSANLGPSIL